MFVLECCMSFILQCHIWQKMHQVCICFLLTNAVLLFLKFCSYEIFSHVHIIPLPWASFFFFKKVFNMAPSQRLCLTIRRTKHLFRGQRKECCISTGLVEEEEKKAMMWQSEPYSQDWLRYRVFSLFSLGVSICEYKAAVTHKYYMVWRCKAGINDWGVCVRERVYGRSLWDSA